MQASGSFELARSGRKRPTNLLQTRESSSDIHCYSPSFNPQHSSNSSPSRVGGFPPTPITAGLPKNQLEHQGHPSSSNVKLPGIEDMLASAPSAAASPSTLLTPPASGRMGSLAPRLGASNLDEDDEGRFSGPRPTWVQEPVASTFVGVRPPASRPTKSDPRYSQMSPNSFSNLSRGEEQQGVVGLGFGMSDATPRIGCFGSNALGLHTPTQSSYSRTARAPSAPSLAQEGRFENTIPASPISPPLQNWNTDLRSSAVSSSMRPSSHIGQSRPRPSSIAMQREQAVSIEELMPKQTGLPGLGVSLSGNMDIDFTKAPAEERVASTSAMRLDAPATSPTSSTSAAQKFRSKAASTGLTPSLNTARIHDVDVSPLASPASPSLRARSKKRSDKVRRQAEAAVSAGLATRDSVTPSLESLESSTSQHSESNDETNSVDAEVPLVSPRKRGLSQRDTNSAASAKSMRTSSKQSPSRKDDPTSPWGVFRVNSDGWRVLGPPGGGKGTGVNSVSRQVPSATSKKHKRLTVSGSSRPNSRDSNHKKENDIPASVVYDGKKPSVTVGGKRPSTAGDVFGNEHPHITPAKPGRFAHVQGSNPSSRPSSAHGIASRKKSPLMGVR